MTHDYSTVPVLARDLDDTGGPVPTMTVVREVPIASYLERPRLTTPERVVELLWDEVPQDREAAWVISTDSKLRLLAVDLLSIGSVGQTFMGPREIFRTALMRGASMIFIAHNHPSGDPKPSTDDRAVTGRVKRAGAELDINLFDHIVLGERGRFTSMARAGIL